MSFPRRIFRLALLIGCTLASTLNAQENVESTRVAWTSSRIAGAPTPPEPYLLGLAFPHLRFQRPSSIEELPDEGRLIVTEIGGKIFSFPKQSDVASADLVVDLQALLPAEWRDANISLFDTEPHPKFRENRHLYVCYVHPGQKGHTRVSRFTLRGGDSPRADATSEQIIITWPSGGHNGGCLEFGTDGYLYISTGDGSGPNPPDGLTTGQDLSDLLGAVLRIDVNRTGTARYSVPKDNPFTQTKGARPEIWAYGLRNPWKFGVDDQTGDIFVADNGWESWEMIHQIVRGGNCGWPVMEGRALLRAEVPVGPTPIIPPVKDHSHTEANSVIGGPVYRGSKLKELGGSFVYGDYITGTIWAIRPDEDNAYSHTTLVDTDQRVIAFTEGSDGELFVLDYDVTGQVYELLPSDAVDNSENFPRRLSETGLFKSLENLEPAPGVVPYDVLVSRWMDGATADRWIAIPGDGKVQFSQPDGGAAKYPEGTVLAKQISLPQGEQPPIRLETQILHFENGVWRPYSYLWDDAGTDAVLVDSIGANRSVRILDSKSEAGFSERTWHVNATNECKLCHNAGPGFVLGFVPNQLNHVVTRERDGPANQLDKLIDNRVVATTNDNTALSLVDPHDNSQDLDARARSYLHVNCSMCHHPGGNAIVSFYLSRDLPFAELDTNKGTGIGTFGMKDAKIIATGDPYRSVLLYRMSKLGYARMPYIGSQVVDSAGVTLIEQWIRDMKSDGATISPPLQPNSPDAKALKALQRDGDATAAISLLLKSTEGSLALAMRLHRGDFYTENSEIAVTQAAAAPTSDIRGLFDTFIPESQRRPTLGTQIDPQVVLSREGDPGRGKLIFFSDNARCRACHDIDNRGQSVGPTLKEINKKYARITEMFQHIVQPSLKIEDPFAAFIVVTDDGRITTGLLVEQSDREVVVQTADKGTVRIAGDEIEEMRKSPDSLMPNQILGDLTAQEAADLLAYIQSLGAAE